jgi:hypothetical protein
MPVLPVADVWKALTKQQLGKYAEYFVKRSFTLQGWSVYSPEVDDRSVDFVAVPPKSERFFLIQVKSIRGCGYAYMRKRLFSLSETRLLALAIFGTLGTPSPYLIPSTVWHAPDRWCFVSRNFGPGRKSEPEWGVEATPRHIQARLGEFSFEKQVRRLTAA